MRINIFRVFLLFLVIIALTINVDVRVKAKVKIQLPKPRPRPRIRGGFRGRGENILFCFNHTSAFVLTLFSPSTG